MNLTEIQRRLEKYNAAMDGKASASITDHPVHDFIAHAPTDIAYLLDLVRETREMLKELTLRGGVLVGHALVGNKNATWICARKLSDKLPDAATLLSRLSEGVPQKQKDPWNGRGKELLRGLAPVFEEMELSRLSERGEE
jgi:hypothetical protein